MYAESSEQMIDAINAVAAYATVHQSPGAKLRYADFRWADELRYYGHRTTHLPAGNPYLPCPDITGDGIENRIALVVPAVSNASNVYDPTQFIQQEVISSLTLFNFDVANYIAGSPILNATGKCEGLSGGLPWRTLGLKDTDSWNNKFVGYHVSQDFSTGLFGFDQNTYSTTLLRYSPILNIQLSNSLATSSHKQDEEQPMIVCLAEVAQTNSNCTPEERITVASSNVHVSDNTRPHLFSTYLNNSLRVGHYYDVTDGLPFVIVMYGQNKRGSVNPNDATECGFSRLSNNEKSDIAEFANATLNNLCTETNNFFPASFSTGVDYRYIYSAGRVPLNPWEKQAPAKYNIADNEQFDDLTGWLTQRELINRMKKSGVLPVDNTFKGLSPGFADPVSVL